MRIRGHLLLVESVISSQSWTSECVPTELAGLQYLWLNGVVLLPIFAATGNSLTAAMDQRRSVFVWTGDEDPFTDDEIGRRMLKYLYAHIFLSARISVLCD